MAGILFEDIFDVKDIDPDGKKFDRGVLNEKYTISQQLNAFFLSISHLIVRLIINGKKNLVPYYNYDISLLTCMDNILTIQRSFLLYTLI